jgi:hypothetical protein
MYHRTVLDGIRRALAPLPGRAPDDETTRFAPLPTTSEFALATLEADPEFDAPSIDDRVDP